MAKSSNIPASRSSGRSEEYLLRIATEMERLVELNKRTREEKSYDLAERNVQQQDKIIEREDRKERDAKLAPAKILGSGILSAMPQLAGSIASPYKTKLEKTLDVASTAAQLGGRTIGAAAGAIAGGVAGSGFLGIGTITGQAGAAALQGAKIGGDIGESLAQTAMALERASQAMELAAQRSTVGAMDSMFGAGVEAGIFTPEEALEMSKENMSAILGSKRRGEEFRKQLYGAVGESGNVEEFTKSVTSSVQQRINDEKSNKDIFGSSYNY